ncbi:MAG: molybdenum cofactor biosynthesis protein MoaE [Eudoraea sp.]|nr:molybdenum cofactor biosynthesis protein MoaE [Eudoraea sp.]
MEKQKLKNVFIQGAIGSEVIAREIAQQESNKGIGAHDIFLGQVRADIIDGKEVAAIEYTAYEAMAAQKFEEIGKKAQEALELNAVIIYHSIGVVKTGELCLFVMISAAHRKQAFDGIRFTVEAIKKEVPVFGKEIFQDDSYQWKVNN